MILRRSDSGCRGKVRIFPLLLALLLAVLVSGDSLTTAATEDKSSSESSTFSTGAVSTTTVGDEQKATTLSKAEMNKYCNAVMDDPLITIAKKCANFEEYLSRATPLDISKESEKNITNFFKSLKTNAIRIDFVISHSSIQSLNLGNVKFFGVNSEDHTSLTLVNNKNLNAINVLDGIEFKGKIIVRGNRLLKKDELEKFGKEGRYNIQKEGECFQDRDNDFENCERIYGDLNLVDFEQPHPPFMPIAISGCLTLKNTKKNVEEISLSIDEFLSKIEQGQAADCKKKSSISNYCVKKEMQKNIKGKFTDEKISFTDHKDCAYTCTENDILTYSQGNCKVINGSLSVTRQYTKEKLELLRNVKIVNGAISIDDTEETNLGFLLNLEEIHSDDSTVPALRIVNNAKADKFGLQNLKKISSSAEEKFVFENNGFNCTETEKGQLERILNVDFVKCGIEKVEPKIVPNKPSKPEKTEETSQQQTNSGDKAKEESEDESSIGAGSIVGIVIGVIAFILIVAGVAGVCVYFLVIKPKKKAEEEKKKIEDQKIIEIEEEERKIAEEKRRIEEEQRKIAEEKRRIEEEQRKKEEEKRKKKEALEKKREELEKPIRNLIEAVVGFKFTKETKPNPADGGKDKEKKEEKKIPEGNEAYKDQFQSIENYKLNTDESTVSVCTKNSKLNCGNSRIDLIEATRVKLSKYKDEIAKLEQSKDKDLDPDYIHANFVDFKKYDYNQVFIATMCPLVKHDALTKVSTTERFYAMVFEQNVRLIIDIDTTVAYGEYFSMRVGEKKDEMFEIKTLKIDANANFKVRTLEITHKSSNETKTIPHLELMCWPDKMKPDVDLKGYVPFIYDFMEEQLKAESGAVLIHCKAGVGRTGILIVCFFIVHYVRSATDVKTLEPKFEEWFKHIREQRYNAVQTGLQYIMMPAMFLSMIEEKCTNLNDQKKITDFLKVYRETTS